jgi:hypothetical protein
VWAGPWWALTAVALCACQATAPAGADRTHSRAEIAVFALNGVESAKGELGQAVLVAQGEATNIDVEVSGVTDVEDHLKLTQGWSEPRGLDQAGAAN